MVGFPRAGSSRGTSCSRFSERRFISCVVEKKLNDCYARSACCGITTLLTHQPGHEYAPPDHHLRLTPIGNLRGALSRIAIRGGCMKGNPWIIIRGLTLAHASCVLQRTSNFLTRCSARRKLCISSSSHFPYNFSAFSGSSYSFQIDYICTSAAGMCGI